MVKHLLHIPFISNTQNNHAHISPSFCSLTKHFGGCIFKEANAFADIEARSADRRTQSDHCPEWGRKP